MDEYEIDVVINGAPDKLKTYCGSIYSAIDSMLGIEMVEEIISVKRTIDNKLWDIKDMDVSYLRQLKEKMDDNLLADAFKTVEDLYIDTIH
tara:strand:- start:431 stop:703 length:273 start_codon:yes stop_codon:yes gene_type:complete